MFFCDFQAKQNMKFNRRRGGFFCGRGGYDHPPRPPGVMLARIAGNRAAERTAEKENRAEELASFFSCLPISPLPVAELLAHRAKDCDPNIGSDPPQTAIAIQIIWGAAPRSPQSRFQIPGGATPRSTQCVQIFSTTGPRNSPRRPSAAVGLHQPSAFGRRRPSAAVGLRPPSAFDRPSAFVRRRPAASVGFRQPSACGRRRPSPAVGLRLVSTSFYFRGTTHKKYVFNAISTNSLAVMSRAVVVKLSTRKQSQTQCFLK